MAKAKAIKKQKSMEDTLWEAANKLRGWNVPYKLDIN